MSSTHASATTRLPPPVIPLEQLPSASIVKLPPSYNKIPKLTTMTTATTTTTTTTNPNPILQQSLPTLATSSFPTTLQPGVIDTTQQQHACLFGYSESRTPNLSFSETSWHNNNFNNSYNLSSSSSLSSVHSPRVVTNKNESTIPFSTITTTTNNDMVGSAARPNPVEQTSSALSEKKLRRLEKNRLSARECRRRKREATQDMEQEICSLEGENLKLRLQLRIGQEAEDNLIQEQERVTEEIDRLLKRGASEAEMYDTIEEFKEKFADYGRDRRSAMEFHLQNIERLLQPTQTTSVAIRALEGGSKCIPDTTTTTSSTQSAAESTPISSDPKHLFAYLVKYLEVTPEQAAALKDSRSVARELDDCLQSSLDVLRELQNRLRLCGNGMETEFDNIRSVLTPTQAAKFLVWVAQNRACMHMLNELWRRVYPDPYNNTDGEDYPSKEHAKKPRITSEGTPQSPS